MAPLREKKKKKETKTEKPEQQPTNQNSTEQYYIMFGINYSDVE